MSAKHSAHDPLIFAWNARDHSTWHLVLALLLLVGVMAGFFVVFRIVHPVAQPLPTTPQHIIALDPKDPAALALIHLAQDRSFALIPDVESGPAQEQVMLAFKPTFDGYQLRPHVAMPDVMPAPAKLPRLSVPGRNVLPPVAPRVVAAEAQKQRAAELRAVVWGPMAERVTSGLQVPDISLTQPTRVQFRVAVGQAGQIITALPLSAAEDPEVMSQLHAAVCALRFAPSGKEGIEWADVSFRWQEKEAQP